MKHIDATVKISSLITAWSCVAIQSALKLQDATVKVIPIKAKVRNRCIYTNIGEYYHSGCKADLIYIHGYYCPYCGGRIVVKQAKRKGRK
jgi:DNA-directed RNA polymerase subunit RPC12/RpoP